VVTGPLRHVAELNIARLHHPLDATENAEFVAALGPINALAEVSDGFVWRLQDESGASSSYVRVDGLDDPLVIVNYSIWRDLAALHHFVARTGHVAYLRRRREWFAPADEPTTVCWWVPAGTVPPVEEGYRRLVHLRTHGPSPEGWPLHAPVDPPFG
jgi:hypothetical protein